MQIEEIDIKNLKPYENNARRHDHYDVQFIVNSISKFGFNDPVGIWGKDNTIVEGHGRVEACKVLGIEKVPCIRLDHLSDEERKAYCLAHNMTAENSTWDFEKLQKEWQDLCDFDIADFGEDILTIKEEQHEYDKEQTQNRVERILNLDKAQFPASNFYDIPEIQPVDNLPPIKEWIGFKYMLADENPDGKAVHFFIDDYQFERIWNDPDKYVDKLKQYVCVASPDFSPYGDMPLATQIFNHYRKHWVGAYLQSKGVVVVPTIRASTDPRSLNFYLQGEPQNSIVIVSAMWTNTDEQRDYFLNEEYKTMVDVLNPKKVFCYGGNLVEEMSKLAPVEYISTKKNFGNKEEE